MGKLKGKTAREKRFDVEVGKRIEMLRQQCRLTQAALATAIGVSPSQLYSIEVGKNRCSPFRLRLIADRLGVPVTELVPEIYLVL